MEWIETKNKNPEKNQVILIVTSNNSVTTARYDNGFQRDTFSSVPEDRIYLFRWEGIKYWQPLPVPPIIQSDVDERSVATAADR